MATRSIEHQSRPFTSFPNANYILPSDLKEKERLNKQHSMLKRVFGEKIIFAPISIQPGDEVLETGTGTGVWLLDFRKSLPQSKDLSLYGIDIESKLFPSTDLSAGALHFSVCSVTLLPREWSEKFSMVHQRFLMPALRKTEWPRALSEIYRVLKPGGWIQLCEPGDWSAGPITEKHKAMRRALYDLRELDLECTKHMPTRLANVGFINVQTIDRAMPLGEWGGQDGRECRNDIIAIWRAQKTAILKSGGLGFVKSEQEFDTLIDDVEREWDATVGAETHWVAFYAQKPL
ncbi:S-adenosyl-L-methionine-dependent methyltransferase [Crucibulum laeve]|uniref:S-adenosyl-L-methionine-dependent methyltransferase n=1 Tax=Crucibulum laeve TaxID=68775 RepID=A0A5C3LGX0_9AGAR|nr:S-adenosyl-L-methionine-dependent methyltransferase [Crucibulum laeve]